MKQTIGSKRKHECLFSSSPVYLVLYRFNRLMHKKACMVSFKMHTKTLGDMGLTAHQHKKAISRRKRNKSVRLICITSEMNAEENTYFSI